MGLDIANCSLLSERGTGSLRLVAVFLFLFLFLSNGWATCTPVEEFLYRSPENGSGYVSCSFGNGCTSNDHALCSTKRYCTSPCEGDVYEKNGSYYTDIRSPHTNEVYCTNENDGCSYTSLFNYNSCYAYLRCTDECEAEEQACISQDGTWVPSNVEGQCGTCDTTHCDPDEQSCIAQGGTWIPSPTEGECGICDIPLDCQRTKEQCRQNGGVWVDSTGYGECDGYCKRVCPDSLVHWEYQSVFRENLVPWCEITKMCQGDVQEQKYVIGSCEDNGFCDGKQQPGEPCITDTLNTQNCRKGGQNGSLCTYVCPDGNLYSCTIAWTPGQPAEYQQCPQQPPSSCQGPWNNNNNNNDDNNDPPPLDSLPDWPTPDSSPSGPGNSSSSVSPEVVELNALRDTLQRANQQRRLQVYYTSQIKDNIEDFGAQFDVIQTNSVVTASRLNTSNVLLTSISSDLSDISDKMDTIFPIDWKFYDLDSLPVWRDTLSEINKSVNEVTAQIDSLRNDTTGVLGKHLPFIKSIADKLDMLTGDCEGLECVYRPVIDTLMGKMNEAFGLDTVTPAEEQDVSDNITRLSDSTYVDGNWYCIEHPDDVLCVEVDSMDSLPMPDTVDLRTFMQEQDSILDHIDSVLKDTTQDTLALDELAGDSALIREKLDFLFLPQNTIESCFEFHLNTRFGQWAYNLAIDFADMFGFDLCDLIRKIVRILTFILIVFTTIKGYIRAFGGGGPGGG